MIPTIIHLTALRNSSYDSYQTLSTRVTHDDRLIAYLREHPLSEDVPIVTNCLDCLNYSLHILNPLYFNDEAYSHPFLKITRSPFYLILFPTRGFHMEHRPPSGVSTQTHPRLVQPWKEYPEECLPARLSNPTLMEY